MSARFRHISHGFHLRLEIFVAALILANLNFLNYLDYTNPIFKLIGHNSYFIPIPAQP